LTTFANCFYPQSADLDFAGCLEVGDLHTLRSVGDESAQSADKKPLDADPVAESGISAPHERPTQRLPDPRTRSGGLFFMRDGQHSVSGSLLSTAVSL
jgi:hypothetical protein